MRKHAHKKSSNLLRAKWGFQPRMLAPQSCSWLVYPAVFPHETSNMAASDYQTAKCFGLLLHLLKAPSKYGVKTDACTCQDDPYLYWSTYQAFPVLGGNVLLQVLFSYYATHGALQSPGPYMQLLFWLLHLCHDLPRTVVRKWKGSIIPQPQSLPWGKTKLRQEQQEGRINRSVNKPTSPSTLLWS